jgi:hypothetical protein
LRDDGEVHVVSALEIGHRIGKPRLEISLLAGASSARWWSFRLSRCASLGFLHTVIEARYVYGSDKKSSGFP